MHTRPPRPSQASLPLRTSELAATLLRSDGQGQWRKRPGHSEHFLERTLRLEGPELDRAMRLYHHSALMRDVVKEQMKERLEERAAIALRDEDESAHVIVTRNGLFVTCLSASMSVGDAALLPYAPLQEAMDRADAQQQATVRRKKQLSLLSAEALSDALSAGPGHVHREMVEIVEMEPRTYLIAVSRAFFKSLTLSSRLEEMRGKYGLHQDLWQKVCRLEGTVTLCFYLFGAMDDPVVTEMLCLYLDHDGPNLDDVAAALARHHGGTKHLLEIGKKSASQTVRRACYGGVVLNALRHPRALPRILAELKQSPLPGLTEGGRGRAFLGLLERLALVDPRHAEILLGRGVRAMLPLVPEVADPTWLLNADEHREHALRRLPVSAMFPPLLATSMVKAAWHRWVRTAEMPVEPREYKRPVVRSEPRVGRNDPCPCGSGKKYKHCCAGKRALPLTE